MDAQTQLAAELYKTLNDAQKQEVLSMIDTLLSQQLNDATNSPYITKYPPSTGITAPSR